MPDGAMEKTLDITNMLRYTNVSHTPLEEGIQKAYQDFLKNFTTLKNFNYT